MSLTLTTDQQAFMRDGSKLLSLAVWTLRSNNHIAVKVRADARLERSTAPTRRDAQHLADYMAGESISASDLLRLINGFNNHLK